MSIDFTHTQTIAFMLIWGDFYGLTLKMIILSGFLRFGVNYVFEICTVYVFICSQSQSPKSFSLLILLYESMPCVLLICHLCLILQQLMRERQQMASRPFASVDVSLEARGEVTEVLQPVLDVSLTHSLTCAHTDNHICDGKVNGNLLCCSLFSLSYIVAAVETLVNYD